MISLGNFICLDHNFSLRKKIVIYYDRGWKIEREKMIVVNNAVFLKHGCANSWHIIAYGAVFKWKFFFILLLRKCKFSIALLNSARRCIDWNTATTQDSSPLKPAVIFSFATPLTVWRTVITTLWSLNKSTWGKLRYSAVYVVARLLTNRTRTGWSVKFRPSFCHATLCLGERLVSPERVLLRDRQGSRTGWRVKSYVGR